MIRSITIFLSILFVCPFSFAQENSAALFAQANQAYEQQKYNEAIKQYESLYDSGWRSRELLFNMANSYYQNGQLGRAVLNYERSLVLSPSFKDARKNLEIVQSELQDEFSQIPEFFLARWWRQIHIRLSSSTWRILTIITWWLAIGGAIAWLMASQRQFKKQGFLAGVIGLGLTILLWGLSRSQYHYEINNPNAIVLETIALKNAPDTDSNELMELHEGTKVKMVDQLGDWYKVVLPDGDQGWLTMDGMERI